MPGPNSREAFVLPLVLLLSTAILSLALIAFKQGNFAWEMEKTRSLHRKVSEMVRWNVPVLIANLDKVLANPNTTTALIQTDDAGSQAVVYFGNTSGTRPLSSMQKTDFPRSVRFRSPVSGSLLDAGWVQVSPDDDPLRVTIAWAYEDVSLNPGPEPPPLWWPLPRWEMMPAEQQPDNGLPGAGLPQPEPVPNNEAIPFQPEQSPSFVPVVTHLGLRFGIFASGAVGSREKVVRIRYYIDCRLWNPYNRPLQMHDRSATLPAFKVLFENLPQVRLHNLSLGTSTSWIPLDEAENTATGKTGVLAWIKVPGLLEPGESIQLLEPDHSSQAEGLARTLHPGFQVGPADEIKVEIKPSQAGLSVSCLELGTDPDESTNRAWFRCEGYPVAPAELHFYRADTDPRPFYLSGGSLSFRQENTHIRYFFERSGDSIDGVIDPRQRTLEYGGTLIDAGERMLRHSTIMELCSENLRESVASEPAQRTAPPLFSWPGSATSEIMAKSDSPDWPNGFRVGSPGARGINALLDEEWPFKQGIKHTLTSAAGERITFQQIVPLNSLSSELWFSVFKNASLADPSTGLYGLWRYPNPLDIDDYQWMNEGGLRRAAQELTSSILTNPSRSISDFFNQGRLTEVLTHTGSEDPLQTLLPLRGWLRNSPPFANHGSAWILHLSARARSGPLTILKSVRVWLLKTPADENGHHLRIIRWEWSDPSDSLILSAN